MPKIISNKRYPLTVIIKDIPVEFEVEARGNDEIFFYPQDENLRRKFGDYIVKYRGNWKSAIGSPLAKIMEVADDVQSSFNATYGH